jgi:hypothetical protein
VILSPHIRPLCKAWICISSILQILLDGFPVPGHVSAAWLFTALSAFQVIGGIDCPAARAGVVPPDFPEPLLIAYRFHPFEIRPQFDPVGHCGLKLFQIIAGILIALAAKVDAPFRCAGEHPACSAIGQPFSRATAVAPAFFFGVIKLSRKSPEPLRVFMGGNKP